MSRDILPKLIALGVVVLSLVGCNTLFPAPTPTPTNTPTNTPTATATSTPIATLTPTPIPGIGAPIEIDGIPVLVTSVKKMQTYTYIQAKPGFQIVFVDVRLGGAIDRSITTAIEWSVALQGEGNTTYELVGTTLTSRSIGWAFRAPIGAKMFWLILPGNIRIDLSPLIGKD